MPLRTVGKYRLTRQLGVGMFSKVMVGVDNTGAEFAVKVMRKDSLEDMDMARYARREAAVLRKLNHPNIVAYVEAIQSETKLFLVMEIARGAELLEVVGGGAVHEHEAKIYMRQLVDAVSYLHARGIVHRDLKPDNVLVDSENKTLKIIDFGLTGIIRKNAMMKTSCGSSYYSAPEVTYGPNAISSSNNTENYSQIQGYDGIKADAWSLGVLAYILLTGSHPFVDADGELMVTTMKRGNVEYPDFLSAGAIHFISRLLAIDARKRYSVAQVSLHPWLLGKAVTLSGDDQYLQVHTQRLVERQQMEQHEQMNEATRMIQDRERELDRARDRDRIRDRDRDGDNRERGDRDRIRKVNYVSGSGGMSTTSDDESARGFVGTLSSNRGFGMGMGMGMGFSNNRSSKRLGTFNGTGNTTTSSSSNTTNTTGNNNTINQSSSTQSQHSQQSQRSFFGRTNSGRTNLSSVNLNLPVRRRSSNKTSSGSFLWFRRSQSQTPSEDQQQQLQDRQDSIASTANHSSVAMGYTSSPMSGGGGNGMSTKAAAAARRGSLDRPKSVREGRITLDFINGRAHHESMDAGPRVRRQLSLSNRTRALLMRGSSPQQQPQQPQQPQQSLPHHQYHQHPYHHHPHHHGAASAAVSDM